MKKYGKCLMPVTAILLVGCLSGCNNGKIKNKEDPTKTNIYVYNFDGGIGTKWVQNAAARFEEKYASKSFEEGKTGVKVHIDASKASIDSLSSSIYNVIFTEGLNYFDLANQNQLLDITDIVKETTLEDVSDGAENVTIESKLTDEQKEAYTAIGDKYYFLPHYETYSGICYDKDVFKKKALYIKDGGGYTNGNDTSVLSVGPNGIKGDYDDGLPSSMEEFFNLMDQMVLVNVVPFIWTGQYPSYLNNLAIGTWTELEGKDRFQLVYELDSNKYGKNTKSNTLSISDSGVKTVTEDTITMSNGYKAQYQEGKYYGYKFIEKILSNPKYYSSKITTVLSHLDAQEEFINSNLENNPIAFLIEGSYWYNEAKDAFARSVEIYGDRAEERNFGWMPLPSQISGQVKVGEGKKNTMISSLLSRAFINANVKKDKAVEEVSKLFLKTMYTQNELENFTLDTGCTKGVNYTISSAVKEKLSKYSQTLIELKDVSDVIDPVSSNKIYTDNSTNFVFSGISNIWKIKYNNNTYTSIRDCLANGATAEQAFMGGITQEEWESSYSKYFQ